METEAREVYRKVEAISETIPEKIKTEMETFESLLRRMSSVVENVKNQK